MKRKVLVNMLICWKLEEKTERVLWTDKADEIAFLIDINKNTYRPLNRTIFDIEKSLENGSAVIVDNDPWSFYFREEDIKDKYKLIRDKAWEVVEYLISVCGVPAVYNPTERHKSIQETSVKLGITGFSA